MIEIFPYDSIPIIIHCPSSSILTIVTVLSIYFYCFPFTVSTHTSIKSITDSAVISICARRNMINLIIWTYNSYMSNYLGR